MRTKVVPVGEGVTLEVELVLADGTTSEDATVSFSVLDEAGVEVYSGLASVASSVATAVIPQSANQLSAETKRAGRLVVFECSDGTVIDTYIVERSSALFSLSIPAESGIGVAQAHTLALDVDGVEFWLDAPHRDKVRALKDAWVRLSKLRLRVWREGDVTPSGFDRLKNAAFALNQMSIEEWAATPIAFKNAVCLAQLYEAARIIEGDPVSERREEGLLSKTVGEASEMFRSGRPLDRGVGRKAISALRGYVVTDYRISR